MMEELPQSVIDEYSGYVDFHHRRYEYLVSRMSEHCEDGMSIAIFGPSKEYAYIRETFPKSRVTLYGIAVPPLGISPGDLRFADLNEPLVVKEHYDIGVCCEVVEHLTRPFGDVLGDFLKCCDTVIIQTPNARSFHARVTCALLKSPFQYVEYARSYGHLYEYTREELTDGFPVVDITVNNYFGGSKWIRKVYNTVTSFLPATFRDGFTVVYSR